MIVNATVRTAVAGQRESHRMVRRVSEERRSQTVWKVVPMGEMILTSGDGVPSVSGDGVASCTTGECPLSVSF